MGKQQFSEIIRSLLFTDKKAQQAFYYFSTQGLLSIQKLMFPSVNALRCRIRIVWRTGLPQ